MEKRMIELFAGVGGFRLGLEKNGWKTVWANQWEPSTKRQHAYEVYTKQFGEKNVSNTDINQVDIKKEIPEHDLLVGGFPCQDYSVARTKAEGIVGKKGVLWWSIYNILKEKKPPFALLENVDRLIKSPSNQRGRDFGIMLRTIDDLGYALEWRVINAADYGFAQRRRRVFLFLSHKSTKHYKSLNFNQKHKVILENGFFNKEFPVKTISKNPSREITANISSDEYKDLVKVSDNFQAQFWNAGFMKNGKIFSKEVDPIKKDSIPLKDILEENVSEEYYLTDSKKLDRLKHMKGSKKEKRIAANGYEYNYSEGGMAFPDSLDKPARTILTSETSINRSTHVIKDPTTKRLRLLTPVEVERLNGFPDYWTQPKGLDIPRKRAYFFMGNALVVGVVKKTGNSLKKIIE